MSTNNSIVFDPSDNDDTNSSHHTVSAGGAAGGDASSSFMLDNDTTYDGSEGGGPGSSSINRRRRLQQQQYHQRNNASAVGLENDESSMCFDEDPSSSYGGSYNNRTGVAGTKTNNEDVADVAATTQNVNSQEATQHRSEAPPAAIGVVGEQSSVMFDYDGTFVSDQDLANKVNGANTAGRGEGEEPSGNQPDVEQPEPQDQPSVVPFKATLAAEEGNPHTTHIDNSVDEGLASPMRSVEDEEENHHLEDDGASEVHQEQRSTNKKTGALHPHTEEYAERHHQQLDEQMQREARRVQAMMKLQRRASTSPVQHQEHPTSRNPHHGYRHEEDQEEEKHRNDGMEKEEYRGRHHHNREDVPDHSPAPKPQRHRHEVHEDRHARHPPHSSAGHSSSMAVHNNNNNNNNSSRQHHESDCHESVIDWIQHTALPSQRRTQQRSHSRRGGDSVRRSGSRQAASRSRSRQRGPHFHQEEEEDEEFLDEGELVEGEWLDPLDAVAGDDNEEPSAPPLTSQHQTHQQRPLTAEQRREKAIYARHLEKLKQRQERGSSMHGRGKRGKDNGVWDPDTTVRSGGGAGTPSRLDTKGVRTIGKHEERGREALALVRGREGEGSKKPSSYPMWQAPSAVTKETTIHQERRLLEENAKKTRSARQSNRSGSQPAHHDDTLQEDQHAEDEVVEDHQHQRDEEEDEEEYHQNAMVVGHTSPRSKEYAEGLRMHHKHKFAQQKQHREQREAAFGGATQPYIPQSANTSLETGEVARELRMYSANTTPARGGGGRSMATAQQFQHVEHTPQHKRRMKNITEAARFKREQEMLAHDDMIRNEQQAENDRRRSLRTASSGNRLMQPTAATIARQKARPHQDAFQLRSSSKPRQHQSSQRDHVQHGGDHHQHDDHDEVLSSISAHSDEPTNEKRHQRHNNEDSEEEEPVPAPDQRPHASLRRSATNASRGSQGTFESCRGSSLNGGGGGSKAADDRSRTASPTATKNRPSSQARSIPTLSPQTTRHDDDTEPEESHAPRAQLPPAPHPHDLPLADGRHQYHDRTDELPAEIAAVVKRLSVAGGKKDKAQRVRDFLINERLEKEYEKYKFIYGHQLGAEMGTLAMQKRLRNLEEHRDCTADGELIGGTSGDDEGDAMRPPAWERLYQQASTSRKQRGASPTSATGGGVRRGHVGTPSRGNSPSNRSQRSYSSCGSGIHVNLYERGLEQMERKETRILQEQERLRQQEDKEVLRGKAYSHLLRTADGHKRLTEKQLEKKLFILEHEEYATVQVGPLLMDGEELDKVSKRLYKSGRRSHEGEEKKRQEQIQKELEECSFKPELGRTTRALASKRDVHQLYEEGDKLKMRREQTARKLAQKRRNEIFETKCRDNISFARRCEQEPEFKERFMAELEDKDEEAFLRQQQRVGSGSAANVRGTKGKNIAGRWR